jgi:hypothetical protein
VFLDGAFVATASLKQIAPAEEFDLYLGIDERVKIERRQLKENNSETVADDDWVERTALGIQQTLSGGLLCGVRVCEVDDWISTRLFPGRDGWHSACLKVLVDGEAARCGVSVRDGRYDVILASHLWEVDGDQTAIIVAACPTPSRPVHSVRSGLVVVVESCDGLLVLRGLTTIPVSSSSGETLGFAQTEEGWGWTGHLGAEGEVVCALSWNGAGTHELAESLDCSRRGIVSNDILAPWSESARSLASVALNQWPAPVLFVEVMARQ